MDNSIKIIKRYCNFILGFCVVLIVECLILLIFGNISFASDTPPILQKLFDYADIYYDIDNTNHTDIISNDLKSALSHIHYNKNTYKTYYTQFSNEEHYNDLNTCLLNLPNNGIVYISFGYTPNLNTYNNYAERYWNGSFYIPLYHFNCQERLRINYNTRTNIFELVEYSTEPGSATIQAISNNTYSYNFWNRAVLIYNDNNYYCSNSNFNGLSNSLNSNTSMRINGMADFGFFNLDYSSLNNEQDFINFGNVYIGYNYTQSNMKCYLIDYDNSEILDNEINLIQTGSLYNGRFIYTPVLEDFSGLNNTTNYELMISSDNSMLRPFYSEIFKLDIDSPGGDIPTGTIIVSGDYKGVGSGEGFNNAINDINNNLNVVNNNISNINNNIKNIGNYISDTSSPDNTINEFFSGDYVDFAEKMGYSTIPNNYYDYLKTTFESIINAINVSIPNYDIHNNGPSITFELFDNSFNISTWDLNPFKIGYTFQPNANGQVEQQHFESLRIIISVFTNGLICYFIIKRFASWIVKLQTLDFNVVNKVDTDINLF